MCGSGKVMESLSFLQEGRNVGQVQLQATKGCSMKLSAKSYFTLHKSHVTTILIAVTLLSATKLNGEYMIKKRGKMYTNKMSYLG